MHQFITVLVVIIVAHMEETLGRTQCYECGYGDSTEANPKCRSEYLDSSLVHSCDAAKPYCINTTGIVDGIPTGVRFCAGVNWVHNMGGNDVCLPTEEVPGFTFEVEDRTVELVNGTICICNEDQCNGPRRFVIPSPASASAIPGIGLKFAAITVISVFHLS